MLSIFAIIVPKNIIWFHLTILNHHYRKIFVAWLVLEKKYWVSYMHFCYNLLFEVGVAVHLNKCEWIYFILVRFVPIVRLAENGQVVWEKKMKIRNVCRQTDRQKTRKNESRSENVPRLRLNCKIFTENVLKNIGQFKYIYNELAKSFYIETVIW